MSDHQSRTASDDLYDHEREDPRSGRRRRPVADWGVGDDMFEHMPRNRFSRAAEGPPRDGRFSRAAETDRAADGEPSAADPGAPDAEHAGGTPDRSREPALGEGARDEAPYRGERAGDEAPYRGERAGDEAPYRGERAGDEAPYRGAGGFDEETPARDDSHRRLRDQPRRWTGPGRDEDDDDVDAEPSAAASRRRGTEPHETVPRGGVEDGRRTIVIGKPEDVPSEIAAITADRDLGDEPAAAEPELPSRPAERRTVRIGGRPEGSLEAARFHRDHARRRPPRRPHERLGARPDRIAMWAFALGLLLIVIAVLSAH